MFHFFHLLFFFFYLNPLAETHEVMEKRLYYYILNLNNHFPLSFDKSIQKLKWRLKDQDSCLTKKQNILYISEQCILENSKAIDDVGKEWVQLIIKEWMNDHFDFEMKLYNYNDIFQSKLLQDLFLYSQKQPQIQDKNLETAKNFFIIATIAYLFEPKFFQTDVIAFKAIKDIIFDGQTFIPNLPKQLTLNKLDELHIRIQGIFDECKLFNQVPNLSILYIDEYKGSITEKDYWYGFFGHILLRIKDCDFNEENDLVFSFLAQVENYDSSINVIFNALIKNIPLILNYSEFKTTKYYYNNIEKRNIFDHELNLSEEETYLMIYKLQHRYHSIYMNENENYGILLNNCASEAFKVVHSSILMDENNKKFFDIFKLNSYFKKNVPSSVISGLKNDKRIKSPVKYLSKLEKDENLLVSIKKSLSTLNLILNQDGKILFKENKLKEIIEFINSITFNEKKHQEIRKYFLNLLNLCYSISNIIYSKQINSFYIEKFENLYHFTYLLLIEYQELFLLKIDQVDDIVKFKIIKQRIINENPEI